MSQLDELMDIFGTELKRGTLSLAVMSQLRQPQYGYLLLQNLSEKQFSVEAGTLYPLLRRLEKQGVLRCDWDTTESRPRKYYVLSELGERVLDNLTESWKEMTRQMSQLLGGESWN
ncbi:PadR family transcriptional regulator [Eubacteriales bacterium OttesenSCG-928-N14]|nr:PadR family transcriptional regulator [Eubacteriales bacterium OttesenSCG-928-N14]